MSLHDHHDHHDLQQLHPHPHPPHPPPLQQPPLPPQPQPQHSYPDDGSFLPSATQLDFRPYAATDLQALASSDAVSAVDHPFAYHAAIPTTATPAAVNPDDFYRNYRGVQTANANVVSLSSPTQDAMASPALPPNRQTPTAAVRNGTGTRPGVRSASSTLDDRLGGATDAPRQRQVPAHGFDSRGNALSVKNLKKKFDQSSPQAADASMNKGKAASSRLPTREALSSPSNGRSPAPNGAGAASSYPALRTGTTRDGRSDSGASSSRSTTQRPRFLPEDELSSNAQSFASRVSRPRTATAPTARPSKSMTHLSPNASPRPPTSPPPPSRGALLFGEILPQDHDAITAGYGIENSRLRPTSESSSQNPARKHLRSHSDPDVEPPSPTDWYRNAGPVENPPHPSVGPRAHKGHSRAHSDAAAAKPINHSNGAPAAQAREVPPAVGPSSPTSRLPISTRKLNSPAPSSGGSSRSNSPALLKQSVGSRMARQQGTPTTRAKTPTSRSNTPTVRAKTPTPGHNASSRKAPPSQIGTPSNGRLNAYVNIAPPKLSPTLRSSRPRQSVATATTTASRMKSSDKTQPPQKSTQRGAPRPDEATVRRRKISVGPIDFAQRRETIKLAYSKSIKETQAKEASRAAAEKRRRDLELVAKAKVEAEAVHAAKALQKLQATEALQAVRPPPAPTVAATAEAASHARQEAASAQGSLEPPRNETPKLQEPLRIATTDLSTAPTIRPVDSPTLGIPGSFPAVGSPSVAEEEMYIPQSAISATSVATEFDIEPQTEPPTQESNTTVEEEAYIHVHAQGVAQRDVLGAAVLPDVPRLPPALHKRASYKYPFEDDSTSIHVTSPGVPRDQSAHSSPHLTPTRSEFDLEPQTDPPIPGSFQDEYEPQPFSYPSESYETTITILGPETDFRPSLDEQTRDADLITQPVDTDTILVGMVARRDVPSEPPSSHVDAFRESPRNHPMHSMQSLEDFYVGPRMRDNIAVLRDSTFTSSDQDGSYETVPSSAEFQKTPETAHSLSVPPLPASNRLSQHSAWTDFSFGSSDERDDRGRSSVSNTPDLSRQQSRSARSARPISGYSSQDAGYEELSTSQPISPLDDNDTSSVPPLPMLDEAVLARHRLPELEVGSGFTVSLPQEAAGAAHDVAARPPSPQPSELLEPLPDFPDHEPPPPPVSEYDLDDSSYAADTRPNSYYRQDDESEEPVPSLSTPHSGFEMTPEVAESQRALPDTKNRHSEVRGPVDAERKRLKQRQLVIRELIDTEAIFIRDLSVVEEIYKGTAEACPKLDAKTIKLVFRNTDEIIAFHAAFLAQLKDGVSSVYTPKGRKSPVPGGDSSSKDSDSVSMASNISPARSELDDEKDRQTSLGPLFIKNIEKLKEVHETYLRSSEQSTKRLLQIQEDPTVNVWLSECNEVARDLTSAWNLDSLLIKPMQRITKYPDIISHLLKHTLDDHPDREPLMAARTIVVNTIDEINKTKKNFELVGQIVGRKRKESEVRAGFARAFGKRVDKIQASTNRPSEDDEYAKLHEKFGDDYLRLQVVLRDVEFYTRTVSNYVHEFLQYLSSIELVMRLQPSKYHAHLEAKWVQFNVSMRDIEKIALDKHVSDGPLLFVPPLFYLRSYPLFLASLTFFFGPNARLNIVI